MKVMLHRSEKDHIAGVATFYMSSLTPSTSSSTTYTIKVIRTKRRRTMTCTCPNAVHDAFPRGRYCKHLRVVRDVIRRAHGLTRIPHGSVVTVNWNG